MVLFPIRCPIGEKCYSNLLSLFLHSFWDREELRAQKEFRLSSWVSCKISREHAATLRSNRMPIGIRDQVPRVPGQGSGPFMGVGFSKKLQIKTKINTETGWYPVQRQLWGYWCSLHVISATPCISLFWVLIFYNHELHAFYFLLSHKRKLKKTS